MKLYICAANVLIVYNLKYYSEQKRKSNSKALPLRLLF
uniref:Uncharacterized protein n=1 Tax=Anguilla anguilla TaxID=7936 RepID=A0A0E9RSU2_ANGAN